MDSIQAFFTDLDLNPWVTSGLILAVSIILAKLVELVFTRVLARLASKTTTDLDDRAVQILNRPIFLSLLFVGFAVALRQLDIPVWMERVSISLLKTMAILVWLGAVLPLVSLLLTPLAANPNQMTLLDSKTIPLFNNLFKIVAVVAGVYLIIVAWHIDATAWLASAGIMGLAVGFAAKDTLANVFSGVFILADAPYKVGDFINLDTGERGEVSHIGLRSTRILTRDDIEVTIPNAVIGAAKIVNETGGRWPRERLRIAVGVAYGSDIDKVRRILHEVGEECELVCPDPKPQVRFRAFGNSGLDFELLVWIQEPILRGRTLDELNVSIYKKFAAENVEIPYPKRDIYIKSMPRPLE